MVLKTKIGLFVCGVAGSAVISLVQPADEPIVEAPSAASVAAAPSVSSSDHVDKGMAVANSAAERPFAAFTQFAPTVR
jgi:hypothetical protein